MTTTIRIREEQIGDIDAIREVNVKAFGQAQEADVVDKLRANCEEFFSFVAVVDERIVGHILFSPVVLDNHEETTEGMGLAPMAVLPEYQGRGIGSRLARTGIASLKDRGCRFVIVLGHAEYYPRFGFECASRYGIRSEWDVPEDAFMILVLDASERTDFSGVAKYRPEFAEAM